MKKRILFVTGLMLLAMSHAFGALYTETFSAVNMTIPDGSPVGVRLSGTVSDIPSGWTVSGLTVSLNVSGGYNGDLYSYIVAPNGTMVVLLNQPGVAVNGFGAGGAGMNITLLEGASDHGSIQNETGGSVLSGSYNAVGTLANFNGSVADGTWTLFFADLSSGGGTSTLNSWSLGITAVPEPVTTALIIFLGIITSWWLKKWCTRSASKVKEPTSC
jgi:subtilisin-like proprotein convertase family protein